mmetsp:Transcript_23394/g.47809  ORF Transcript_23394/g.47809 Transcript_23394/m.47809 type:complete len:446 (-) Transcript_23394:1665-3002(-)
MKVFQPQQIIVLGATFLLVRMVFASFARGLSYLPTARIMTTRSRIASMTTVLSYGLTRHCVLSFHWNLGWKSKDLTSSHPRREPRLISSLSSTLSSTMSSTLKSNSSETYSSSSPRLSPLDENYFLNQVDTTIARVFHQQQDYGNPGDVNILDLPEEQREAFGIGRNLDKRLKSLRKNNDCPRCWMQRKHCICEECSCVVDDDCGIDGSTNDNNRGSLKRIFLVMHHKEIGLKVDTAKLILSAFPFQCELVVGGIGPEHQDSMKGMLESIQDSKRTSLLLFPDETAKTLKEIVNQKKGTLAKTKLFQGCEPNEQHQQQVDDEDGYDLIVLDGTWAQARKFHSRYFSSDDSRRSLQRVQLSEASVELLQEGSIETGHQLRRHEIAWRQVGTFEAFRLFMRDWSREFPSDKNNGDEALELWKQIESYQQISNDAALKELGPPRSEIS